MQRRFHSLWINDENCSSRQRSLNTPTLGVSAPEREALKITTLSVDFRGTLHSKTGFPLMEPDRLELYENGTVTGYEVFDGKQTVSYDSIYFPEYLDKKDKYAYLLGQVQPMVTIYTEAQDKDRLLMFKDSYAHCLIPMWLNEFSEIRLIDLRFFNADNLAQINISEYDRTLFLYSADVFAHQLSTGNPA